MSDWTHRDFENLRKDWKNNRLVGWKLHYTSGLVIPSTEMPFNAAPQDGVQVLVRFYERERGGISFEPRNGDDLYTLFHEQALELDLPAEVKKGENLDNDLFLKILAMAKEDAAQYPVVEMHEDDLKNRGRYRA